jgi:hypothetical protein
VIGLPVAYAARQLVSSSLYGLSGTDPATFTAATLLHVVVAALAACAPARRAMKVDPMAALRCE